MLWVDRKPKVLMTHSTFFGFLRSSKCKTFTVKHFRFDNRVSRSRLLAFLWIIFQLREVSGTLLLSQSSGIHGSNAPDKINIEHNVEMVRSPFITGCLSIKDDKGPVTKGSDYTRLHVAHYFLYGYSTAMQSLVFPNSLPHSSGFPMMGSQ